MDGVLMEDLLVTSLSIDLDEKEWKTDRRDWVLGFALGFRSWASFWVALVYGQVVFSTINKPMYRSSVVSPPLVLYIILSEVLHMQDVNIPPSAVKAPWLHLWEAHCDRTTLSLPHHSIYSSTSYPRSLPDLSIPQPPHPHSYLLLITLSRLPIIPTPLVTIPLPSNRYSL